MSMPTLFTSTVQQIRRLTASPVRKATLESVFVGGIGQSLLIVSGVITANLLGVEGRGRLALLVLFPIITVHLLSLGIPQAVSYFAARNPAESYGVYKTVRNILIIQMITATAICALGLHFYLLREDFEYRLSGYVIVSVAPALMLYQYGLAFLQGLQKFRLFNRGRLLAPLFFSFVAIFLFWGDIKQLPIVVFSWATAQVISSLIIIRLAYKQLIVSPAIPQSDVTIRDLIRFGLKGMIGYGAPLQTYRLDQLVAGFFLSPVMLGYYVVAQAFTNLPKFIADSISMVAYPVVAKLPSPGEMRATTIRFLLVGSFLCLSVTIVLFLAMPTLVIFFFREEFSYSSGLARILIFGSLFFSIKRILVECARGMKMPEVSTYAELSLYPLLLMFGVILIPMYELYGVALTVMIAHVLSFVFTALLFIRRTGHH